MAKKEELFDLIKSLTRSEKRYFRLFSAGSGVNSNYLKLFEAMEQQPVYDEDAIKKKLKNETFVKQLHVTKHYLRNAILKSLRNFHSQISRNAELKDVLRNVEILFHKELYTLCRTELTKAEELGKKHQLYTGLAETYGWKRKLEQALDPRNYQTLRSILHDEEKFIAKLQNTNTYWQLAAETTNPSPTAKQTKDQKLLTNPNNAQTREARVLHHNIAYYLHVRDGKNLKAKTELYKLIAYLEQFPQDIAEDPAPYVSTINNLVSYLVFQKKSSEALELIEKAKSACSSPSFTAKNKNVLKQILRTYNIELEICRDSKVFQDRADFITQTEQFIEKNLHKIPKDYLISFWFQLAHIHFMRRDFVRSLHWLNLILNTAFKQTRIDLQVQARMLNLIVHLEQQNLFVLRYFVDNTKRFLKKVEGIRPFEKILLNFFIKIDAIPLLEYKKQFKELRGQLFPEKGEDMIPAEVLDYINYKTWIDEKINCTQSN